MSTTYDPISDQQLLDVISTHTRDGIAIHVTDKSIIQYANDAMINIWGKSRSVIGKSLEEALPELKGQPFIDMFKKVWYEGVTISGSDTPAQLNIDGELQTFYFDFEYRAIKDLNDKTYCILHTATDVTKSYLARQREQSLSEELHASNEELHASNEELFATNEELIESQRQQQALFEDLTDSNLRFRNMVRQAPIGICIIRAEDLLVQEVNDAYLELVGKQRSELEHRTIWDAVPEAAEVYAPIMNGVIETGEPFKANEAELILVRNGVPENVFVDFVYEPIKSEDKYNAIMVLGIDVTEKVHARRNTAEMEERIRLAVEAAETGTFDLDLVNRIMLTSDRFNTIFGFDRHVPWQEFARAIHPDDRKKRETAHNEAYENGKLFYEARVIYQDASIHWIRVLGKVYYDKNKPVRILGTIIDITELKRLMQQKDDFISIASHELKTPITSLKASLQLLERMKDNPSPALFHRLIEQSGRSMQKISNLVEDLLNVSRSNEGQLKLNKTTFNVYEMLTGCCNHVRSAGKYKLTTHGDKNIIVYADEHAIDQVIVNFVNNAVKYAPDSLEIFLIFEKHDGFVKMAVKDTGPGIPEEKIPFLFDRYYQTDTFGYKNSGLGLGLFISAEIIKRHGGEIGVDSELGKGSTFWFTIPLNNEEI